MQHLLQVPDVEKFKALFLMTVEHQTDDFELVKKALDLSEKAHEGQMRKGGDAYITHPIRVALRLAKDGYVQSRLMAIALLHDVIEDCGITKESLAAEVGAGVAEGVWLLSKTTGQYEDYFKNIRSAGEYVKLVKIYDRIDNLETMASFTPEKRQAYIKETKQYFFDLASFQAPLQQKLQAAVAQW
jgi:GTP diphosphokinase / guanosine-3',5'-bis(diphosphate) 3'-diphosphatase